MLLFNLKDLKQNYKIVNVIEIDANHIDENRKNASLKQNKNKTYVYLERKSFIFGFIQNISSLKGMQFNLFKKQLIDRVF